MATEFDIPRRRHRMLGTRSLGLGFGFAPAFLEDQPRAIKPMPTQMAESAMLKAGQRKEET
jgi:hypothetical protein